MLPQSSQSNTNTNYPTHPFAPTLTLTSTRSPTNQPTNLQKLCIYNLATVLVYHLLIGGPYQIESNHETMYTQIEIEIALKCNTTARTKLQNHKLKNRKKSYFRCCLLLPLSQLPSSLLPPPSALRLAPTPLLRCGGWAPAGNGLCCCCC